MGRSGAGPNPNRGFQAEVTAKESQEDARPLFSQRAPGKGTEAVMAELAAAATSQV